jgi:predicted DNA-binding transcriptional regulator AlpA
MAETLTAPRLLPPKQAATYLAISERKLWGLTKKNRIQTVRIDRCVRYDIADLDAFIQAAKG